MSAAIYYRQYELPWSTGQEGEERFRKILRNVLAAYLLLALAMPFLPVLERDRSTPAEVPERIVQLIVEQPKPPPPPPPPVPEVRPEPRVAKVEPRVEPKRAEAPVDRTAEARRKAASTGLLALQDQLADLRDDRTAERIAGSRAVTGAVGDAPQVERALITSKVGQGSGGVSTAAMSRNTGGGGLAARATTKVDSGVAALAGEPPASGRAGDGRAARSREEIEMVFDQNKGAIYALYNRALRNNPSLQGKLVLKLTIEGSGEVSACEIVSSDLGDEELERKLVQRVKMFRFLTKDVPAVTTTKPIDFFPA